MLSAAALERFEIRSRVGQGSFGTVYEAFDRHRNRIVALKVLSLVAPETVARFKREFRTLASIRHPNLAGLYELLVLGGQWLLTMELIRGSDLLEHLAFVELQETFLRERIDNADGDQRIVLRRKPVRQVSGLYFEQVRFTFQQLAVALGVLHANGVVHRDIKPSNIMITRDGRVVVLDFGLAAETSLDDSLDRKSIVGTPGYMSPEQAMAMPPTAASDWYSFGVLLHQALTGKRAFDAGVTADLPAGVPEDLAALAADCLQREPGQRPSDAEVLARIGVREFDPSRVERSRDRTAELIGRGKEIRTFSGWIDRLEPGEPRLILISGAPGVGKTSLLDGVLDRVRIERDVLILAGRCQPWESLPFNAVDGLVDSLAREIRHTRPAAAMATLGSAVAIGELFPALAGLAPPSLDDTLAIPRGDRVIAAAAAELRALIEAAAGGRTVLIVIDDAQWGDYQSARILAGILAPGGKIRVAVVLAYTFDDWRTSLFLQGLDLDAVRPRVRRMNVAALSPAMTTRFVRRSGRRAAVKLVDRVRRETGGNPALMEIALADEQGSLSGAVAGRLAALSSAAQSVFSAIVTSGLPVEEGDLEQKLELFETDEALRSLAAQRLVRLRRTGNLSEIAPYHDRLRTLPSVRKVKAPSAR